MAIPKIEIGPLRRGQITNVTKDRKRAAILAYYNMDCFMPNENWFLTLSPLVRQSKQVELLKLLGFGSDSPLGRVNGRPAV